MIQIYSTGRWQVIYFIAGIIHFIVLLGLSKLATNNLLVALAEKIHEEYFWQSVDSHNHEVFDSTNGVVFHKEMEMAITFHAK